jgi:DNA sulfur modification protein DndB
LSSYTIPAIEAHMGSSRYYQAVMTARELAATVRPAMDFEEFDSFMAHERMQRKLSEERVEQEIVPYLTNSSDRFFGSIIVLVYQPELFEFESLQTLLRGKLPGSYEGLSTSLGALTISGGKLFALDGQHRLHALRTVISGNSRTPILQLPIEGPFKGAVEDDELSVIFLEFESIEKARRIFNKVNRYAKPTTKSTNILTSEDDGYAIITRCLINQDDPTKFDAITEPPIPEWFKNGKAVLQMEGTSIKQNSPHLTTLQVIYDSVQEICKATKQPTLDEKKTIVRPTDQVLHEAYEVCAQWWTHLIQEFQPIVRAFNMPDFISEDRHYEGKYSMAYRPKGLEAIIGGMLLAHECSKLVPSTIVERTNKLNMHLGSDMWRGILTGANGTIMGTNVPLAKTLIAYQLVGDAIGARRFTKLEEDYRTAKRNADITVRVVPKPLF